MRTACWFITIAVFTGAVAISDSAVAAAATAGHIPIEFVRNHVRLWVTIQGTPFQVVLDTGMPTRGVMLYRSERVDALKLAFEDAGRVAGGGGDGRSIETRVATAARVEIGALTLADVPVIVLPAPSGLPMETNGVIGSELFEKFAVRVNVDELHVELFENGTFAPPAGGSVVPLRFRDGSAFVDARVAVGSGEPITADLAVDLGASHALWLNVGADGKFAPGPGAIVTRLGRGLSGDIEGRIGRVRRVELGGFAFENVVAMFPAPEHQHPGGADFRDGFVGAELLTRCVVTYDYAGRRLILERGERFAAPFEYDMSGMVLDPAGADRRVVHAVLPGSPAEQAGVAAGDVLIAVDGESVRTLGPDRLKRAFRTDGAEVGITLERASARLEKRIRLRRLV